MVKTYYRPIPQIDRHRPEISYSLAGGRLWFDRVERLRRGEKPVLIPADQLPDALLRPLTNARPPICGIDMQAPSIMGILNATPDSFSDGGRHFTLRDAQNGAREMLAAGADILDIGGESTRPGAGFIPSGEEIRRTVPVIEALEGALISIDTRKADVARAAIKAGASLFNDVTALTFDPDSLATAASLDVAVCLMHASGDPETMQENPSYDDVLLDVYDYLGARIAACEAAGIARHKIMIDPGIGFGKNQIHNLTLLRGLSLFHGLGCPILLGVSRKRFIGTIGNAQNAADRAPGSIAVALAALNQGVQMLRVHDIVETRQAIALWQALHPID